MSDLLIDSIKANASPDLTKLLARIEETFPKDFPEKYLTPLNLDAQKAAFLECQNYPIYTEIHFTYDYSVARNVYSQLHLKPQQYRGQLEDAAADPDNDDDAILYAIIVETLDLVELELAFLRAFVLSDYPKMREILFSLYDAPTDNDLTHAIYRLEQLATSSSSRQLTPQISSAITLVATYHALSGIGFRQISSTISGVLQNNFGFNTEEAHNSAWDLTTKVFLGYEHPENNADNYAFTKGWSLRQS